jgi:hypothetical protein
LRLVGADVGSADLDAGIRSKHRRQGAPRQEIADGPGHTGALQVGVLALRRPAIEERSAYSQVMPTKVEVRKLDLLVGSIDPDIPAAADGGLI